MPIRGGIIRFRYESTLKWRSITLTSRHLGHFVSTDVFSMSYCLVNMGIPRLKVGRIDGGGNKVGIGRCNGLGFGFAINPCLHLFFRRNGKVIVPVLRGNYTVQKRHAYFWCYTYYT